jgi:hypothetical protein
MKITFEITNAAEAASAVAWVRALSNAFQQINGEMPPGGHPPMQMRQHPSGDAVSLPAEQPVPKKSGHSCARADAGGARPGAGRPRKIRSAPAAVVPEQLDLIDRIDELKRAEKPRPANLKEAVETLRERLKVIATERGFLWTRDALAERGVGRISELTDKQVQELVNAAP